MGSTVHGTFNKPDRVHLRIYCPDLLLTNPQNLTKFLSFKLASHDRNILVGIMNVANIARMIMSSLYPQHPKPNI